MKENFYKAKKIEVDGNTYHNPKNGLFVLALLFTAFTVAVLFVVLAATGWRGMAGILRFLAKLGLRPTFLLSLQGLNWPPVALLGVVPAGILCAIFWVKYSKSRITWLAMAKKRTELAEAEEKEYALGSFYRACVEAGINDVSTPGGRQKMLLLAAAKGFSNGKSEEEIFAHYQSSKEAADSTELRENQEKTTKRKNSEISWRERENRYLPYSGREKRIQMLTPAYTEAQEEYAKAVAAVDFVVGGGLLQKEKDWATNGGIASGIAGGAAGLAVALDTMAQNEKIRKQNAESRARVAEALPYMVKDMNEKKAAMMACAKALEQASIVLVGEASTDEVFASLRFTDTKVKVTDTGTVNVQAYVEATKELKVFDTDAVADGSLCAKLYRNGRCEGTAYLTLPAEGVGQKRAYICGYCTETTAVGENITYEVRFEPNNLWLIEKMK